MQLTSNKLSHFGKAPSVFFLVLQFFLLRFSKQKESNFLFCLQENYLAALSACRFQTKKGWREGSLGSVYEMINKRPIQSQTSILDSKAVFQMGFLSHVINLC